LPCDIKDTECWRKLNTYSQRTTFDKASNLLKDSKGFVNQKEREFGQKFDNAKDFAGRKAQ